MLKIISKSVINIILKMHFKGFTVLVKVCGVEYSFYLIHLQLLRICN